MSTPALVAHQSPGRIRLEIPSRRGDEPFFAALSGQMAQSGQVSRARANPAAASLVLEYAGQLERLLGDLKQFDLELNSPARGAAVRGGRDDTMLIAGVVFGVVGVVQTLRGDFMVPAMTAFWYATMALRLAHGPPNFSVP